MKNIQPAQLKYVKTIYDLENSGTICRINVIAAKLAITVPACIQMIRVLAAKGLVLRDNRYGGLIMLTQQGIKLGKELNEKFEFIKTLLSLIVKDEEVITSEANNLCIHLSDELMQHLSSLTVSN